MGMRTPTRSRSVGGPGAGGDDGHVARLATAIGSRHRGHVAALDHEGCRGGALLQPDAEAPRGPGERGHGRHRAGLSVEGAERTAETTRGDDRRHTPNVGRAQDFHRHAVNALLGHPAGSLAPCLRVQGDAQATAPAIPGRAAQLAIELRPPRQARERQRSLGRVAAHHAHAGRARPGSRRTDLRALEEGHAHARVGAAQVKRRAEPHQSAPHDHDRPGHGRSLSQRL